MQPALWWGWERFYGGVIKKSKTEFSNTSGNNPGYDKPKDGTYECRQEKGGTKEYLPLKFEFNQTDSFHLTSAPKRHIPKSLKKVGEETKLQTKFWVNCNEVSHYGRLNGQPFLRTKPNEWSAP
ncbi:hypothetical protein CEXT_469531 [Caerostris extrusa]|uniref:Uncharacterized protein n=1 Tax=Caerostris extrusa TaxID=172846 RepID=A0AAV4PD71_CAEEX|nr:hypothetical protein CEXT_469531 [Caerostris extrusa]